jgi:hypothetical protein
MVTPRQRHTLDDCRRFIANQKSQVVRGWLERDRVLEVRE